MSLLKRFIVLLLFPLLMESCSGPSELTHEPIEILDSSVYLAVTVNEYISLPFTASAFGKKGWFTEKKIQKSHNAEQVEDTLITMRYKESIIHYQNQDLLDVFLVNPEIHLMKHIHVGMARDSFNLVFSDLENKADNPYVSISDKLVKMGCCSEQNDLWMFHFDADTIYQIDYNGYVD